MVRRMSMKDNYILHSMTFKRKNEEAFNVAYANGRNLQPWHLDAVEKWLADERAKFLDGSDLV